MVSCSVRVIVDIPGPRKQAGSGTVVAVKGTEALVLTCRHVVTDERTGRPYSHPMQAKFPDGRIATGKLYAVDDVADLAAIVIPTGNAKMPNTAIGDSPLQPGEKIVQVGYGPKGMDPIPLCRGGVCTGNGGLVEGRWRTQLGNLWSESGDSGGGVFRESSGYLVGVLWGGDLGNHQSSNFVGLEHIERFMEKHCKDWCRPKGPATAGPSLPPVRSPGPGVFTPAPGPDISALVAEIRALKDEVKALKDRPAMPGPQGERGPAGERGPIGPSGQAGSAGSASEPIDYERLASAVAAKMKPEPVDYNRLAEEVKKRLPPAPAYYEITPRK